jgi:methylthioribose-1-phosphate isomerase
MEPSNKSPSARPPTIAWIGEADGHLELLDQRSLPERVEILRLDTVEGVWSAIQTLAVRGAPAIGCAAAYGMVIAARRADSMPKLKAAAEYLKSSRPTAVNLMWAVDRVMSTIKEPGTPAVIRALEESRRIHAEDAAMCDAIGRHGAPLIHAGDGILTHCNAGRLATGGSGTALAIVYEARRRGVPFKVYADETRPLLQGARLTAWELMDAGIDATLICDSMAAMLMAQKKIRLVIVGADRIAANGDTANKIGTYSLAIAAAAHGVTFAVAAPSSTFDLSLADGSGIPIEERDPAEITAGFGRVTAPPGVKVFNPAFDLTPARLIHSIVTERGIITPVNTQTVRATLNSQ